VDWRRNKQTDADWWASLKPGWQRERRENFAAQAAGQDVEIDMIDDGWTDIFRKVSSPKGANRPRTKEERNRVVELADFRKMEEMRKRVADTVRDPATAESLKPYYRVMCKRPTFKDEFLECFNRDNVTLVDVARTMRRGVATVEPTQEAQDEWSPSSTGSTLEARASSRPARRAATTTRGGRVQAAPSSGLHPGHQRVQPAARGVARPGRHYRSGTQRGRAWTGAGIAGPRLQR
jgi:cation diffusion facilitator CzcD-associated flavoprotein CzcO